MRTKPRRPGQSKWQQGSPLTSGCSADTTGSLDPFTPPLIRPNFLSEHLDLDTLVAGMRIARKRRPAPSRRDPAENAG